MSVTQEDIFNLETQHLHIKRFPPGTSIEFVRSFKLEQNILNLMLDKLCCLQETSSKIYYL